MTDNTCPKDGLPESTYRFSRRKRLSICNNGHSWPTEERREQRELAKQAEAQEKPVLHSRPGYPPVDLRDIQDPFRK